ncbi:unnamed protein product [Discosporangium mesarthrocarpum]
MISKGAVSVLLLSSAMVVWMGDAKTYKLTPDDSIQEALKKVDPGDTIKLKAGSYWESFETKTDGKEDDPITIEGPDDTDPDDRKTQAIIRGDDSTNRVFQVFHSYYTIKDLTFDGKVGDTASTYRDKLLYVEGNKHKPDYVETDFQDEEILSSINGLVITNNIFKHAGGECVRLRYFVTNTDFSYNHVTDCGIEAYVLNPDSGSKNGEGIYIGTSSNQWKDNRDDGPDESNFNHVHHNYFDTMGNECVDIKEGASYNLIEKNECGGQLDDDSGGINIRGDYNTIRYNSVKKCQGAGVRIGGNEVDGETYGHFNRVYKNDLKKNEVSGIKVMTKNQDLICDNDIMPTKDNNYKDIIGDYADDYPRPEGSCPDEDGKVKVLKPKKGEKVEAGDKVKVKWEYELPIGIDYPIQPKDVYFTMDLHKCKDGDCGKDDCGDFYASICDRKKGCYKNDPSRNIELPDDDDVKAGEYYVMKVGVVGYEDLYDCSRMFEITD